MRQELGVQFHLEILSKFNGYQSYFTPLANVGIGNGTSKSGVCLRFMIRNVKSRHPGEFCLPLHLGDTWKIGGGR